MKIIRTRIRLVALTLLVGLVAANAFAQGGMQPPGGPAGQSMKGVVIKGRAPVSKELLKVKLPRAEETTLPNGLRIVLLRNTKVPTFTMQMVILSGGLNDPADYHGLASFTGSLLREGTAKRTSKDIAEQVDTIGASLTTGSGLSTLTSVVTASGLVESMDQTFDIFADVVRNPSFPKDEVDKYKARSLATQQSLRSNPQFLAQEQVNRALYGDHPAGLVVPPAAAIKRMSSEDLAKFHDTYYRPNNAILAVVGDIGMKELLSKVQRFFGDWQKADIPAMNIAAIPAPSDARIYLIDRPGSVQTVLQLASLAIERNDPDYFAVLLANRVLGGGPAARLFINLREDKGYTYGAYSSFASFKYRGAWVSSSEVRTDVTDGAMHEFMYELKRLRDEKVGADELDSSKRSIVGSFALSLEQPQALLQNIITQKLYNLPADYWDTYPQKISALTAEDVQRVAQKYIDLDHLQIIAVGDAAKTREILAKYGKLQINDAEGKPLPTTGGGSN